jgi:glycine oxidase
VKIKPKIGIVGAGILGRLLAFQCALKGWQVTLFDKGEISGRGSCAYAAGGMLAPIAESMTQDPSIYRLGMQGIERWKEIIFGHQLPIFFQQEGSVLIAHTGDEQNLHVMAGRIKDRVGAKEIQFWNQETLKAQEPELNIRESYFLPREGQIDARATLNTLDVELQKQKVIRYFDILVTKLDRHVVSTAMKNFSFDWVFDCRGLGAADDLPDLRPVRGELMYVYAPDVQIRRVIRLLHRRYPIYIIPRPRHLYLIGATEIEAMDDSSISVRSTLELLSAAYSVHSGFSEARIVETVTGLRPTFTDHLPKIYSELGLTRMNGLYRHGFLIAPILVDEAIRLCERGKQNAMAEGALFYD